MSDDRLLPRREVLKRLGISNSTLYRLRRRGGFPAPVTVAHGERWLSQELDAWLAERAAEREAA